MHSGDVTRVTTTSWTSQSLTMFLFDQLIVYAKKDLLGKKYVFKGRIELGLNGFEDLMDGSRDKDFQHVTAKNAIKVIY